MRASVAVVVVACAACSLVVPLDDLRTGDAATEAATDAATEASTDAGATDGATPFCKQAAHTLCDDFDELPLGALWSSQHVASASLSLDDAAAASPPRSLLVYVAGSQGAGVAYLQKDFTGSASRITCTFEARVDALSTVPILSFEMGLSSTDPNRPDYNVTLLHTSAKTTYSEWTGLADGGGASNSADLPVLPVGASAWTHVVVDMQLAASTIGITFDGVSVLATTLAPPPHDGQTLVIGAIEYIATPATIRFDDVACDIIP